jgi:Bacterial membrane protein YfhO
MLEGRAAVVGQREDLAPPEHDEQIEAVPSPEPAGVPARSPLWHWVPLALVGAVAGWNLWSLRATTLSVAYLNDASVHEQMVRDATRLISAGKLPFTSWFADIGLGSAQFLHYQSLGSVLTGLAGTVVGANAAFRWSLYLLLALWPFAIYASARLFGLPRPAAAAAAVVSPFVVSYTGVGFEHGAYVWIGGAEVWTQLLGSWALPFAWACTWRAMKDARFLWPAAALIGLTVALHFMCGYLALLGVVVIALAAGGRLRQRLARAVVLFGASLAAAAWVIVPLIALSKWSAINQPLAETAYVRGYGVRQELVWLFTGPFFDARRALPVITAFVFLGALCAIIRWRRDSLNRTFLALFVASLLLSFGSTTWGGLANLVPAHADLYFRRFTMGSQLAGIYLAGTAVVVVWQVSQSVVGALALRRPVRYVALGCVAAALLAWTFPAVREIANYDQRNTSIIQTQRTADATQGAMISPLIAYIKEHGGGRTYAGLPNNWGHSFTVGFVPVYKYLENEDVDEVTYVVPTLSLMLDPETNFDEDNPSDYSLFGIRYILIPSEFAPPVPATRVMVDGIYALWQIPSNGYVDLLQVTGTLSADRADVGTKSWALLYTVPQGEDWAVDWPGLPSPAPPAEPQLDVPSGLRPPGTVNSTVANLPDGMLRAEVTMAKAGTLLLSVSYDPGWHAWVDGRETPTEMLAPALVGIHLSAGEHDIVFRYVGFRWYPELWALGLIGLAGAYWAGRTWSRTRTS